MSLVFDLLWESTDCILKKCNIRTDCSVASRKNLRKLSVIIRQYQSQTIQLPGKPDWALPRPGLKFFNILRLGK